VAVLLGALLVVEGCTSFANDGDRAAERGVELAGSAGDAGSADPRRTGAKRRTFGIACGSTSPATECDVGVESCCVLMSFDPDYCFAPPDTCSADDAPVFAVACDEASDCPSGMVCCGKDRHPFPALDTEAWSAVLCTLPDDCNPVLDASVDRFCGFQDECPAGLSCTDLAHTLGYPYSVCR
jgi:hypothetical protein